MFGKKTYFVMLKGPEKGLLSLLIESLPGAKILWAGLGDFIIDPPWKMQPRSFKTWDVQLVLQETSADGTFRSEHIGKGHQLAGSIDIFALEVKPTAWEPSSAEQKEAKEMAPKIEPEGLVQVLHRNWRKVLSLTGLARNTSRAVRIMQWVLYHTLIAHDLLQPFHMINLLKFDGGEGTYDLYRDTAGKLVMADGGGLAFLGTVEGAGPDTFDEVMIVAYKHRLQFFRMALLTPSYWPLSFLRDEGLQDGMLHATVPIALRRAA